MPGHSDTNRFENTNDHERSANVHNGSGLKENSVSKLERLGAAHLQRNLTDYNPCGGPLATNTDSSAQRGSQPLIQIEADGSRIAESENNHGGSKAHLLLDTDRGADEDKYANNRLNLKKKSDAHDGASTSRQTTLNVRNSLESTKSPNSQGSDAGTHRFSQANRVSRKVVSIKDRDQEQKGGILKRKKKTTNEKKVIFFPDLAELCKKDLVLGKFLAQDSADPFKGQPIDPDNIEYQCPDFGFENHLNFALDDEDEQLKGNFSGNWKFLMDYASPFPRFERLKNYIQFVNE